MAEITTAEVKIYLKPLQGKEVTLNQIRQDLNIIQGSKSWDVIRNILFQLSEQQIVRPVGQRSGVYKVVEQVEPVEVDLDRDERPLFNLIFPRDFDTMMEMNFAPDIVIREGDLITIGGVKSQGKTTLCLNFGGENIDKYPVLMGNEYTIELSAEEQAKHGKKYGLAPRFFSRIKTMNKQTEGGWIQWRDDKGKIKFTLLPVRDDYAEHIVKDRINIIDWINLDGGKLYDIGKVLEGIKHNLGRGIGIIALQKSEIASSPRGGQFVRDFSDVEILLDGFGDNDGDILLTLKGVKEKHKPIVGKTYAYTITGSGVRIINFREVKKCRRCHVTGYIKGEKCEECFGNKYVDA